MRPWSWFAIVCGTTCNGCLIKLVHPLVTRGSKAQVQPFLNGAVPFPSCECPQVHVTGLKGAAAGQEVYATFMVFTACSCPLCEVARKSYSGIVSLSHKKDSKRARAQGWRPSMVNTTLLRT